MTERISTEQQKVDREAFDEGYEIVFGGWNIMTEDPPGQPHETRTMRGKLWWRPTNGDTWKCKCGDLVPKRYEVCPICKLSGR